MEAIFILFGEFLAVALTPLITLIVEMMVLVLSLLGQLFGFSVDLGTAFSKATEIDPERQALRRKAREKRLRVLKRISIVALVVLTLTIATLAAMQWVFFENALRWVMSRVERNTGIKVEFATASGNFFTGRFDFTDLRIARPTHPQTQFDFRIDSASVDVSVSQLLSTPVQVKSLKVSGIEGDFHRVAASEQHKPRRRFIINQLNIKQANVRVTDGTKEGEPQYFASIERWESVPLRSQFAVFDILFRSNASGSIEGQPFVIATEKFPDGRKTRWAVSDIPVTLLTQFIGGPLRYFKSGTVDVLVEDVWTINKKAGIDMDWKVTVKDFEVATPERPVITRLTDPLVIGWLKQRGKRNLEFAIYLKMNEEEFTSANSLDATGFWEKIVDGLTLELASLAGVPPEKLREELESKSKAFKDYMDKRRNAKPTAEPATN